MLKGTVYICSSVPMFRELHVTFANQIKNTKKEKKFKFIFSMYLKN